MMIKKQLLSRKEEAANMLLELEKENRYSNPLANDELKAVIDPVQGKGNRHTRRKRAAISRAYMKRR